MTRLFIQISAIVMVLVAGGCQSRPVMLIDVVGVGSLENASMAEAEQAAHKQSWVNAREQLDLMGFRDHLLFETANISGRTVRGGYEIKKRFAVYPPQR